MVSRDEVTEYDLWFCRAVELADELGLSRGPVANPIDAEGWSDDELREALARKLREKVGAA